VANERQNNLAACISPFFKITEFSPFFRIAEEIEQFQDRRGDRTMSGKALSSRTN